MTDLQEHSRIYVARARQRKAETMAFLLWASNIPPDDVERMNAHHRRRAEGATSMSEKQWEWALDMTAEPIVPAWKTTGHNGMNGAELQLCIIRGFADKEDTHPFEKTFTFKEHGEFFRGALTMASLRYAGDFYELLKRYGTIKVTIVKRLKGEEP